MRIHFRSHGGIKTWLGSCSQLEPLVIAYEDITSLIDSLTSAPSLPQKIFYTININALSLLARMTLKKELLRSLTD